MARIFVSYKRQDKDIVYPIVEEIKQKTGIDCWIDLEGIESGDQFQNVIIDAIDNADIVIFMLSKNFIAPYRDEITGEIDLKKQTFPEKEVMYALRHNKRLIPISIDGTTETDSDWLLLNFGGNDYIDWSKKEQREKIFRNINKWTGHAQELPLPPLPPDPFYVKVSKWLKYFRLRLCAAIIMLLLSFCFVYLCYSSDYMYVTISGVPKDSIPVLCEQLQKTAIELNSSANEKIKDILSRDSLFNQDDMDSFLEANPVNGFCYDIDTDNNVVIKWIRKVLGKDDVDIYLGKNENNIFSIILSNRADTTYASSAIDAVGYMARAYSPLSSLLFDYTPPTSEYNNCYTWDGTLYDAYMRGVVLDEVKSDGKECCYYEYVKRSLDEHNKNRVRYSEALPLKVMKMDAVPVEAKRSCEQLIIVTNQRLSKKRIPKATLYCFEKMGNGWRKVGAPIKVNLGKNGISNLGKKREGDGTVPAGCYSIYRAFGYDENIKTGLDFQVVNDRHLWICKPTDDKYNTMIEDTEGQYIEISDKNTYEKLRRSDVLYKYAIVVEYNVNPVVKGKGSAVFIHIERRAYSSTAGCIAMPENNILELLQWLDKSKHPYIYITKDKID